MDQPVAPLVSGEGVQLELAYGGVGSRLLAALLDAMIELAALFFLTMISVTVAGSSDTAALRAVLITEVVLVLAGYPIVLEWLTKGRTVGKMALGLRVTRDDGGPIAFRQALVRGLAGLLLEKPGLLFPLTTVAGVATMAFSAREKRIGDMMAGTVVINERSAPQVLAAPPAWVPPPMQQWVLSVDMSRLDDSLALAMRQFITRAYQMTSAGQFAVETELRHRLAAVLSPPPPPGTATPDVLMSVLAERRRRATTGQPGPWRAPYVAHVPQPTTPQPRPSGNSPFAAPS